MERRFEDLATYLAEDVVMAPPRGQPRVQGLEAAVESYREFLGRCEVDRFVTRDHVVTLRGATAVIEYDWDMGWRDQATRYVATGREVLALAKRQEQWRVVWRTQLSA